MLRVSTEPVVEFGYLDEGHFLGTLLVEVVKFLFEIDVVHHARGDAHSGDNRSQRRVR